MDPCLAGTAFYLRRLLAGQAAQLAAAVRVARAGSIGGIGPFALDLPLRAAGEGDQRRPERPGALVSILGATAIVPAAIARVRARLGELVAAHVCQRRQPLRV